MKICSVCKEEKELEHFYKQTDGKFGVTSRCKPCILESNKKYVRPKMQAIYTENWRNKDDNRKKALATSRL